jgi:hypothetical protein
MERYTDSRGRSFRVPRGLMELVSELEWAVEADSAQDRNSRTERRRYEARDALLRFLAEETPDPVISVRLGM